MTVTLSQLLKLLTLDVQNIKLNLFLGTHIFSQKNETMKHGFQT